MPRPCSLALIISLAISSASAQNAAPPRFEQYRVVEIFHGTPADPILASSEQRNYRTRIRDGVLKTPSVNFAGHYSIVRWGCGSQCVMMAIVDAKTGIIYPPPPSGTGSELYIPLDNLSDMKVDFRADSQLLVLRNACRDFRNRTTCGIYYLNWENNRFSLLKFIPN